MDAQPVERAADAFQQPVSADQIQAMCRRAFGDRARVARVAEIGVGTYNSTYRVDIEGHAPVVLRVAPDRGRQSRGDRDAMRNEYAAAPYFASLGALVPRILTVDFSHQLIGRDYMFQALIDGVPAAEGLERYPRARWVSYYRQLGAITRAIHEVRGERFGRLAETGFATWSQALADQFLVLAGGLDDAGLDSSDVHRVVAAVDTHRAVLDDVGAPRLLHGDLWRLNILVDPHAAEPTIVGVLDWDGASWGDPMADWTIHRVRQRPSPEVDAFWDTYGHPAPDAGSALRASFYQARHLIGVRLDIHRRGIPLADVPPVHWNLGGVLAHLGEHDTRA